MQIQATCSAVHIGDNRVCLHCLDCDLYDVELKVLCRKIVDGCRRAVIQTQVPPRKGLKRFDGLRRLGHEHWRIFQTVGNSIKNL